MPPSHPRPETITALSEASAATGDHAAVASEELLDHLVTVGDHTTQATLETVVDDAVDALRELSATCRELSLSLGAHGGSQASLTTEAETAAREHG